jgi:tight adherence protein C
VLLTDGADTSSSYSPEVAADVAKEAGALVYAIGLGPDANDAVLRSLTEPSGGKYYKAPTAADLQAIYAAISVELDSQLFLRYRSATRVSRSYELVKVQVKYTAPDGQVLVRTVSYRPPTAALLPKQPGPTTRALAPFATPFAVPLPAGMSAKSTQSAPTGKVSLQSTVTSWVAAFLASVAALLGTIGLAIVLSPSITSRRVDRYLNDSPVGPSTSDRGKSFAARVVVPFVENIGRKIAGLGPKSYVDLIQSLLTLTGPPYRMTVGGFLGIQIVLTTLSVVLIMLWVAGSNPETAAQWILALLVAALVGLYLPYFWLKRRVTRRKKALLRALPGALDFLAINVEAGLGFDAALAQVVKRWRNTLTDEFALLLIDFQIGKARKDAWKELIERTQVAELTTFITAMLQNEQVGVSISTLLRTQADQMRVRRRQAAEESARTAPVKMLLPMVFFIFPSIFVIILGPAIPQFLGTFTQMGK